MRGRYIREEEGRDKGAWAMSWRRMWIEGVLGLELIPALRLS
jgi:hypothetical protein